MNHFEIPLGDEQMAGADGLREACEKVDKITRTMSEMADKLASASADAAPFLEAVLLGLWRERAKIIEDIDGGRYA